MSVQIGMGVQDSSDNGGYWRGKRPDLSVPYMDEWLRIRNIMNGQWFECSFENLERISIITRVGGRFNDFEGGYGPERRRYYKKRGILDCDMVFQWDALLSDKIFYSAQRANDDFLGCFDYLFSHPQLAPFPDRYAALRADVQSKISP